MIQERWAPPPRLRLQARIAAPIAAILCALPPARITRILRTLTKKSSPPDALEVAEWRNAVNSVSRRCAGNDCLQRSLAVMLLGASKHRAPIWCTGFRVEPFLAHAWIEVDGDPIGEPAAVREYLKVIEMRPAWKEKEGGDTA